MPRSLFEASKPFKVSLLRHSDVEEDLESFGVSWPRPCFNWYAVPSAEDS